MLFAGKRTNAATWPDMGHPVGRHTGCHLFWWNPPHQYEINFINSYMYLFRALHPPEFKSDLTKSRLNGALCLCEMLLGTYPDAASNGGVVGIVVLGVV
jgi:hypothetical protein